METGGGEASRGNKTYQCPQDLELLSYSSPLCFQKVESRQMLLQVLLL